MRPSYIVEYAEQSPSAPALMTFGLMIHENSSESHGLPPTHALGVWNSGTILHARTMGGRGASQSAGKRFSAGPLDKNEAFSISLAATKL